MSVAVGTGIEEWAARQAERLLAPLGDRWWHVQGVVRLAQTVGEALSAEARRYLIAAAYLHDVGYSPELQRTGFHPLDGASFVSRCFGDKRLACLVAHHSEARFLAELTGYDQLLRAYPRERSAVADALTYCDQLTGPTGAPVSFRGRVADVIERYGDNSLVAVAMLRARPYLALSVARTVRLLRRHGIVAPDVDQLS